MIQKSVIRAFLNRSRKDFRPFKNLSDKALELKREQLPIDPPLWNRMFKHQRVMFLLGALHSRWCFFADTGTGKTVLSIALIRYFLRLQKIKRVLVLVPRRSNKAEWTAEIEKHSPKTKFIVLPASDKWQTIDDNQSAKIAIETYAGLMHLTCKKLLNKKGDKWFVGGKEFSSKKEAEEYMRKKKKKNQMNPNPKLIRKLLATFDGLIMDESHSAKTKNRLPYRLCRQISKKAGMVFALTGTPFGNDPTDLWAQLYLVDHGETLGETLGLFRAAFFTEKTNYWGGYEYTFQKDKQELLNTILANRTIRYEAKESDLPAVSKFIKHVSMTNDAQTYYQKAKDQIIAAHGNLIETKNAFLRMRQISSGFLGFKDDETGARAQFEFTPNPKLELLISLVESIPANHKIIIFNEFIFSGNMICQELDDIGIKYVRLYGGTKEPDKVRNQFINDPKIQVLVLQNSMGIGLNLQAGKYGIFYESPVSLISRKQCQGRFIRQQSAHSKVFMYDLVMRDTADQKILDAHASGIDLFKAIVDGKVKL